MDRHKGHKPRTQRVHISGTPAVPGTVYSGRSRLRNGPTAPSGMWTLGRSNPPGCARMHQRSFLGRLTTASCPRATSTSATTLAARRGWRQPSRPSGLRLTASAPEAAARTPGIPHTWRFAARVVQSRKQPVGSQGAGQARFPPSGGCFHLASPNVVPTRPTRAATEPRFGTTMCLRWSRDRDGARRPGAQPSSKARRRVHAAPR